LQYINPFDMAEKAKPHEYADTPQSARGGVDVEAAFAAHLSSNEHGMKCFKEFLENEKQMCAKGWAVFYHLYIYPAPMYEVNAAVGRVLFRFRSKFASLPRILLHTFEKYPDAPTLEKAFPDFGSKRDHHVDFRQVGISAMCSLVATGPEANIAAGFNSGYGCGDVDYRGLLDRLLMDCGVPEDKVKAFGDSVIALCKKHGLDTSQFPGGSPCASGKPGHLMQIFLREDMIDELTYSALPYGVPDASRKPIMKWVESGASTQTGQVRIVTHPAKFMRSTKVHLHVASADPTFHANRAAFQDELTVLLAGVIGFKEAREAAAQGIFGREPPSWWTADDQSEVKRSCKYGAWCCETDEKHNKTFSHPADCKYELDGECTHFSLKHRDKFRHKCPTSNVCKAGKDCTDWSMEHRMTLWHGKRVWRGCERCKDGDKCTEGDNLKHQWMYRHRH